MPLVLSTIPVQAAPAVGARPAAAVHSAASAAGVVKAPPPFNNYGLTKEVFGYAYGSSLGDPNVGYPSWDFNLLSTVAFFSIHVSNQGILVADSNWDVWNSSTLTGLVTTAHAHGVKVVVTIRSGGADMCGALYGYQSTVDQIVAQVQQKGADGVNIDYEGQLATCTNPNAGGTNYTNQALLTNLAKVLRGALNAAKPGYYLSIATYSGSASGPDGFFNIPDLNQWVDSFFVMAYDMDYANQGSAPLQNCPRFCMAPVSPLVNYYWNDTVSMQQYAAVVGPGKTILGQPYYGRVSCVAGPASNAMSTSAVQVATYLDAAAAISSPDVRPGTYSINRDAADTTGLSRWDAWYDNVYGCWREMYWSDITTLSTRYDFVNQNNLRGVGIWTLQYGGGATELWNAIHSHFVACTSATLTPNPVSPQLSGTAIQFTAGSTACVNPRYQLWMQPPGGVWTVIQPFSPTSAFSWSTAGRVPGVYHFSLWARDVNSPNVYDTYATYDYQLTTSPCTAMSVSAAPTAGVIGNAVTVTGSATGCPNPSFQFWMQPPGGAWRVVQPYSTNANFAWSTSGWAAGTYTFSVWARDASSLGTGGSGTNTYDAFAAMQYSLGKPSCSPSTATATPASTATIGTQVTIATTTAGCPNARYQVWLQAPGGTWTVVQPYAPNANFAWNTLGRVPGTYQVSVWVRDAASSSAYDSFSAFQYTLTRAPCTAAGATPAPASPSKSGTTVTITASATGCPNAVYQFWVLPPGGAWTLVQSYSTTNTFTWTTTGDRAGSYLFSVWARDLSSTAAYDAYSTVSYSLN